MANTAGGQYSYVPKILPYPLPRKGMIPPHRVGFGLSHMLWTIATGKLSPHNNHPAPSSSHWERVVAKCGLTELVHQYPSSLSFGLYNSEACAVSRVSLQDHPLLTTHDYTFGFSISLLLLSKQAIHFQIFSTQKKYMSMIKSHAAQNVWNEE